jgi:hypothetical protein
VRNDHGAVGDEHEAVTIADMVDLLKLGTAIDARRRSAPPATEWTWRGCGHRATLSGSWFVCAILGDRRARKH